MKLVDGKLGDFYIHDRELLIERFQRKEVREYREMLSVQQLAIRQIAQKNGVCELESVMAKENLNVQQLLLAIVQSVKQV